MTDYLDRPEEAIKCYERAIEIDPLFADAWGNKGIALVNLTRLDQALDCFLKAAELNPDDPKHQKHIQVVQQKLQEAQQKALFDFSIRPSTLIPYVDALAGVQSQAEFDTHLESQVRTVPELLSDGLDHFLGSLIAYFRQEGKNEKAEAYTTCRERLRLYRQAHPEIKVLDIEYGDSEIGHLVERFIQTSSWEESRSLVLKYPDLLNNKVVSILVELIEKAQHLGDERTAAIFTENLQLLRRCRQIGIEDAFDEIGAKRLKVDVLIHVLVQADSLEELQSIVEQYPELLTDRVDASLAERAKTSRQQGDPSAIVGHWIYLRRVLRHCRTLGVLETFVRLTNHQLFPIDEVTWTLLNSDLDTAHTLIEKHPELLTDDADLSIEFFIHQTQKDTSSQAQYAVSLANEKRELLKRCREIGVAAAFADEEASGDDDSPRVLVLANLPLRFQAVMSELMVQGLANDMNALQSVLATHPELQYAIAQAMLPIPDYLRSVFDEIGQPPSNNMDVLHYLSYCQRALNIQPQETDRYLWASLQQMAGNTLSQLTVGGRAENLEQAILHLRASLQVYTQETQPVMWAMDNYNLARVLRQRVHGKRSQDLEEAIEHYQAALEVYNPDEFPFQWGNVKSDLAIAFEQRSQGVREINLEEAISHCQDALKVHTREKFPFWWANAHHNLSDFYAKRVMGDRLENVEQSIQHFEAALEVFTLSDHPERWADLHHNLGNMWLDNQHGSRAENLEQALICYEATLKAYTRRSHPVDWAWTQMNLGLAYSQRVRGDRVANQEKAITHYRSALEIFSRDETPENWALTHIHLARVYDQRIEGDVVANTELAIKHYRRALKALTPADFPEKWALLQVNLAQTLLRRGQGNRARNFDLDEAFGCCQNVLESAPLYSPLAHQVLGKILVTIVQRNRQTEHVAEMAQELLVRQWHIKNINLRFAQIAQV